MLRELVETSTRALLSASTCAKCSDATKVFCAACVASKCPFCLQAHPGLNALQSDNGLNAMCSQCNLVSIEACWCINCIALSCSSFAFPSRCPTHGFLKDVLCVDCDRAICGECRFNAEHGSHRTKKIMKKKPLQERERTRHRSQMRLVEQAVEEVKEEATKATTLLATVAHQVEALANKTRQRIRAEFASLAAELRAREAKLLGEIDNDLSASHKRLDDIAMTVSDAEVCSSSSSSSSVSPSLLLQRARAAKQAIKIAMDSPILVTGTDAEAEAPSSASSASGDVSVDLDAVFGEAPVISDADFEEVFSRAVELPRKSVDAAEERLCNEIERNWLNDPAVWHVNYLRALRAVEEPDWTLFLEKNNYVDVEDTEVRTPCLCFAALTAV